MKINKIDVDEDRSITIIDDAFTAGELDALYTYCISLQYKVCNVSNFDIQNITDRRLRADLPQINITKLIAQNQEGAALRRSLCPDCGRKETIDTEGVANIPDDNILKCIFHDNDRVANFNQVIDPEEHEFDNAYVNCGLVNDSHEIHVDGPRPKQVVTMLVYPNRHWEPNWGGETAFYEEDQSELVYLNPYVPGRICIFDGSIPHCAKPQALIGDKYRYTIAVKFSRISAGNKDLEYFSN